MKGITTCLWFDNQAEDAARFYTSVFKNSRITRVSHFGEAGFEIHGRPAGSVMLVEFELDGRSFSALNGGPLFKFSEAISLVVECDSQEEIDHYWSELSAGGDPQAQQCGWLKDKYGVSWQVVPTFIQEIMAGPDRARADKVMAAFLQMEKIDIAKLKQAYG